MKYVIYDIETLINCTTFCFLDYESGKKKSFVIFNKDEEIGELYKFLTRLTRHNYWLVGFNCNAFDAQIIEYFLDLVRGEDIPNAESMCKLLYNRAQKIINLPDDQRFKELIPDYKFSIPHIDLFKQKHYDRPQKATSLKWLQFTMRYHTVEEMPIPHDALITEEMIPSILEYNWNDVDSTAYFFKKIQFETDLRLNLSEKFGLNLINAPEPRLAREIFGKYLSEQMGISYKDLKKQQTHRTKIAIKDIIFPYVKFTNPEFVNLHNLLLETVLTPEDKFEKILNVYGLEATFALGGLHSNNKPKIVKEDDNYVILSSDVTSLYPNLAIRNKVKPEHLGDIFNEVYEMLYEERKKYEKKDPMNYVIKIILNSAYGLSAEKSSYLLDVQFTRTICINGELSLLMLCEMVKSKIPEAEFLMLNTDGLEVRVPREKKDLYYEACIEWEAITKLNLEHAQYTKMVIRDVNNYLAIDTKGGVKKKGAFETEMDFHKNPSFLVIPKAIEAYFVKGQDYRTFIKNHEDLFDFFGGVKKKSNFDLNFYSLSDNKISSEKGQKVTRVYVAQDGRKLYKDFHDGRRVGVLTEWLVEPCNLVNDSNAEAIRNNLNYNFYIKEAEKIITSIEGNSNQLVLFT